MTDAERIAKLEERVQRLKEVVEMLMDKNFPQIKTTEEDGTIRNIVTICGREFEHVYSPGDDS